MGMSASETIDKNRVSPGVVHEMILNVGATPYCQWSALTPLLVCFGWDNLQARNVEVWYQEVAASAGDVNLLLYSRPETAVGLAIETGQDPGAVLQEWLAAAQHMLAFYKSNEDSSVMLNVGSVQRAPQHYARAVTQYLGLRDVDDVPEMGRMLVVTDENQLLAAELIARSPVIDTIITEMTTNTVQVNGSLSGSPRVYVLDLYRTLQAEYPQQTRQTRERCTRILEALTDLENSLESERHSHVQTKKKLDQSLSETKLTLRQLFQIQEEFQSYSLGRGKERWRVGGKAVAHSKAPTKGIRGAFSNCHRKLKRFVGRLRRLIVRFTTEFKNNVELLNRSELFDATWYLQQYPDVAISKFSPAEHYILYGGIERRDPSVHFSTEEYLNTYVDVAESGMNPLVHYLRFGKKEGRAAVPQ